MSILGDWITKQTIGKGDDEKAMGVRLADEWDLTKGRLEGLTLNDPTAEDTLRAASYLLQVLTTTYGSIAQWTLSQHHLLYRTACRVWGANQLMVARPNWSESH